MPNLPSIAMGSSDIVDFVIARDGKRIFATTNKGDLLTFDASSGAMLSSSHIGNELGAIDIAPDGSYLLVVEKVPTNVVSADPWWNSSADVHVYKVDTASGSKTTFTYHTVSDYYEFRDVAILADGNAYLTQNLLPGWSGSSPTIGLDPDTGAFSKSVLPDFYHGALTTDPLRRRLLIATLDLSAAELTMFDSVSGRSDNNGIYENDVSGYAQGIQAFSEKGNAIALYSDGNLHIYDINMSYVINLTTDVGVSNVSGLAFDPSGKFLYVIDSDAQDIAIFDTDDWIMLTRIDTGALGIRISDVSTEITFSPQSDYFMVLTDKGIVRFENYGQGGIFKDIDEFDQLQGNSANNILDGMAGSDVMRGGDGKDLLVGGNNNDTLYGDNGDDVIQAGWDDDTLFGGTGKDWLEGGDGDDILDGGPGRDTMIGGKGDDIYYVEDFAEPASGESFDDIVIEKAGEGTDTIRGLGSVMLVANVENGELLGGYSHVGPQSITGNALNNVLDASAAEPTPVPGQPARVYLNGGKGDDRLIGSAFHDLLDGGVGADVMEGRAGSDTYIVDSVGDVVTEKAGDVDGPDGDLVISSITYTLTDHVENLTLTGSANLSGTGNALANLISGNAGSNVLSGLGGDDRFAFSGGFDTVDGGEGNDTLVIEGRVADFSYVAGDGFGILVGADGAGRFGATRISNVEGVEFLGGSLATADLAGALAPFDALRYVASNKDLIGAIGADAAVATQHFANYGFAEHRDLTGFDALGYVVGYVDLMAAFGTDLKAATTHYIQSGVYEGRTDDRFDLLDYVASNPDLIVAVGADRQKAAEHYIRFGYGEGRTTEAFDAIGYLASNGDLLKAYGDDVQAAERQYILAGYAEGRRDDMFDALQYVAGYEELIGSIGLDAQAAAAHYVHIGYEQGRAADNFDALRYVASNGDLIGAIGEDEDAAASHYIRFGHDEHRSLTAFDPLAYAAANADLAAAFGSDMTALTRHYIDFGFAEHRSPG
jgi:Ca2+-binding RTX toxin-like protein